jgi:hypothetical protein
LKDIAELRKVMADRGVKPVAASASQPDLPPAVRKALADLKPDVTLAEPGRIVFAATGREKKHGEAWRGEDWEITALSGEDGKVLWRWPVPPPGHSYEVRDVRLFRVHDGILVRDEWHILGR